VWFHAVVDILPVVTDPLGTVTVMRDRYDLDVQLLADPPRRRVTASPAGTYVVERDRPLRAGGRPFRRSGATTPDTHIRNDFANPS